MNWINVKEKLPQNGEEVLTYYDWSGLDVYTVARYDKELNSWIEPRECMYIGKVTHWTPLFPPSK